ncbi:hypothetical protein [Caldimonas thermodepolymerans]|uniref:hypothetical protein n=1 Tax=Caldimonas thermodepolymerans TaxID=215580 RepID=UPI0024918C24|nr:hypothetical protein [Caldimonas thermodepolymerans]
MIRVLLAAVAVLFALLGWSLWRAERADGRATAAEAAAADAQAQLTATRAAMVRDAIADTEAATARRAVEGQVAEHHERARRVEEIAHAPRPPVPVVCPLPDPRLVRELEEGAGRVRSAADRLRGLHPAAGPGAAGAAD